MVEILSQSVVKAPNLEFDGVQEPVVSFVADGSDGGRLYLLISLDCLQECPNALGVWVCIFGDRDLSMANDVINDLQHEG